MATAAEQEKQKKAREYEKYVKQVTPTHSLFKNMCRAFLCGGAICVLGQGIMNFCMSQGQMCIRDSPVTVQVADRGRWFPYPRGKRNSFSALPKWLDVTATT